MIFCMHVEEIKLFNVLKFHQFSSSGLAIIMDQKSAKIRRMHFSFWYTYVWHFDFIYIREKQKSNFRGFLTHDNG